MDVLFLDANILFSAAYRPDSGLRRLWRIEKVELVTSGYAVEEARRNLVDTDQRARLADLLESVRVVPERDDLTLPAGVDLAAKDVPILLAAIVAGASHLLTGDMTHFGPLMGRTIRDVRILYPADYLRGR